MDVSISIKRAELIKRKKLYQKILERVEFDIRVCDLIIDPDNAEAYEFITSTRMAHLRTREIPLPLKYKELAERIGSGCCQTFREISPQYFKTLSSSIRKGSCNGKSRII